jgi:hypothetical protein
MTNAVQFIGDNRSWIFDGIGVFILTSVVALLVFYFGWWQKRERLTIVPKKFLPAYDLEFYGRKLDVETMQRTTTRAKVGVKSAILKILLHNLTTTPVILVELQLINAENNEVILQQDTNAQRIDANDSGEVDIPIGSTNAPCYKPPSWRGQIKVKTVRKKEFSSPLFNFGDLV